MEISQQRRILGSIDPARHESAHDPTALGAAVGVLGSGTQLGGKTRRSAIHAATLVRH
jgi:hypothetical protein